MHAHICMQPIYIWQMAEPEFSPDACTYMHATDLHMADGRARVLRAHTGRAAPLTRQAQDLSAAAGGSVGGGGVAAAGDGALEDAQVDAPPITYHLSLGSTTIAVTRALTSAPALRWMINLRTREPLGGQKRPHGAVGLADAFSGQLASQVPLSNRQ